jgi:hypothetical protein
MKHFLTSFVLASLSFVSTSIFARNANAQAVWDGFSGFGDYWHDGGSWDPSGIPLSTRSSVFRNLGNTDVWFDGNFQSRNVSADVTFDTNAQAFTFTPITPLAPPTLTISGNLQNNSGSVLVTAQNINVNTIFSGANRQISATGTAQTIFGGTVTASSLSVSKSGNGAIVFNQAVSTGSNSLTTNNSAGTGAISFNSSVAASSVFNQGSGVTNYSAITASEISNSGTGQVNVTGAVSSGGSNLTITKSNSGSIVFGGTIGVGANTINVNNSGAGGNVAFNGAVTAGAVNVTGSQLQGTGAINALTTVSSGGSYSAGNGVGTQAVAGLNFSTNATPNANFVWDLNKGGTGADTVTVGSLGLAIGTGFRTQINSIGASVVLGDFWDVFTVNTGITGDTLNNLLGGSFIHSAPSGINFQWSVEGGTVGRITAVPEPSSMALLGMAGLIGGVYARRRAKKNKA